MKSPKTAIKLLKEIIHDRINIDDLVEERKELENRISEYGAENAARSSQLAELVEVNPEFIEISGETYAVKKTETGIDFTMVKVHSDK